MERTHISVLINNHSKQPESTSRHVSELACIWIQSPTFRSSSWSPQTLQSRDKPFLLCPVWTSGPQRLWQISDYYCFNNNNNKFWGNLLHSNRWLIQSPWAHYVPLFCCSFLILYKVCSQGFSGKINKRTDIKGVLPCRWYVQGSWWNTIGGWDKSEHTCR